ncbi:Fic family protein [Corynebacterium lizhenjunii]|uniref:protein adenylyltransferase n=2 Tax=Corynebacterium lizhenjunii TaxID=2709394 RepID=A0A7T0KGN5_9CORY|nr:Fic family protein [Corynebacterium lizhenjunii]
MPGTQVLRNLFGITDSEELHDSERAVVYFRMMEFCARPLEGNFDYAHFRAIHHMLFQDVYEWAGQERTAPTGQFMVKDGHAYYPAGPELRKRAEALFAGLRRDDFFRGLAIEDFVPKLAELWGELNVVHSFREGNTRTQWMFFKALVEHAGHSLDIHRTEKDAEYRARFIAARYHSQDTGDNSQLATVLREVIS